MNFLFLYKFFLTIWRIILNVYKIPLTNTRFELRIKKICMFAIIWLGLSTKSKSRFHKWIIDLGKSVLNLSFFPIIYVKKSWYFCWISQIRLFLELHLILNVCCNLTSLFLLFCFLIVFADLRIRILNLKLQILTLNSFLLFLLIKLHFILLPFWCKESWSFHWEKSGHWSSILIC